MFFSVITISYNSSKYIRDAIESVLASSFTNFEYIIGDDCSTDDTWDMIKEYNDPRIVRYRNEINLSEYINRNKALNLAKGEWLIFIDGDDVIHSHSLGVLFSILSKFNDIAIAVMCPENENYIAPLTLNPKQLYEVEFSEHGLINRALSHTIYKTNILKDNPFKTDIYIGLDTLNRLEILMKERCLIIQDNLTWWRRSPNQASKYLSYKNEMFAMSKALFLDAHCPLSIERQQLYIKNSKIKLIRIFYKLLLKFKFFDALKLYKVNHFNLIDLIFVFFIIDCSNPLLEINEEYRFSIK